MINDNKTQYWYTYYNNGNIESEGNYENDEKNGYLYFYNTKGDISKEGYFKNGL